MRMRTIAIGITLTLAAVVTLVGIGWPLRVAQAADGNAVAIINGHSLSKRRMVDVLMESHGLQILQQLIVLELAKQQTDRYNLRVTAADVDREFERALEEIAPEVNEQGKQLTPAERQQVLDYLLAQKGLSLIEFKLGMERNAHLRKLVERDLRIDEATLREEFRRQYGEKVEVRRIQIDDRNTLYEALRALGDGEDFADVARRVSQDAETAPVGGLSEPFAFNDERWAPVLREKAFSMEPGEVSTPIRVGRRWFIIKLERRISPRNVRFEDVREEVERKLRERVIPQEMEKLVLELYREAEIRVLDRDLRPKFEQWLQRNQRMHDPENWEQTP